MIIINIIYSVGFVYKKVFINLEIFGNYLNLMFILRK